MAGDIRILQLDDCQHDRERVREALCAEDSRFHVTAPATRAEFEAALRARACDLVLTDLNVFGFRGVEVIDAIRAVNSEIQIVILTASGSEELAVEAMKRGAADYVVKSPERVAQLPQLLAAAHGPRTVKPRKQRQAAQTPVPSAPVQLDELHFQARKIEAIGQLAGGIAHDFNNILSVILGRAELLHGRLKPDDPARRDVEIIHKSGERAANLTRQLLAYARRQVLLPRVLDLNAVIREMQPLLRRLLREDIALELVLASALGRVQADLAQFQVVLLNLVSNARDAMPQGGTLTITTANVNLAPSACGQGSQIKPGPHVVVVVSDTGCGIANEIRDRLFEPFFTTKGVGKGTGLGLSTVQGIVAQSGGAVEVDSKPGHGATFRILLPAIPAREQSETGALGAPAAASRKTVLVVEDEAGVRELMRDLLEANGYNVLAAGNGEDALRLCREHGCGIDLLLTDMVMPGMGGDELAGRMRQARPGLRVVFMSGHAVEAPAAYGGRPASDTFLQKPFSPAMLGETLREALG